jgi:hypothetical protein
MTTVNGKLTDLMQAMRFLCHSAVRWGILPAILLGAPLLTARASSTNSFGFSGREIYPIDEQISLLHVADLDGDGLNDIIVANNLRSKIDLLYNLTGKTNLPAKTDRKLEINELPSDSRFRIDSITADERISALGVADMNGDGRPDIIYYGDAHDLKIVYNLGANGWSEPKTWHLDDGRLDPNAFSIGDLNGDGLTDIVVLGDNGALYYLAQQKDHTMAEPQKIAYSGTPKSVQIVDVDGDGKDDLLLVDWDSPTPFRFRLQIPNPVTGGQLGPEIYFKSPAVRAFCADHLENDQHLYITTIAQNTGRAEVSQFVRKPSEPLSQGLRQGQLEVLPLNKSDVDQRGLRWADVNGDGLPDLLVAEPESGQLSVYLQQPDGTLAAPKKFPTLAGISQIAVGDWNGDGHPDIFLLSKDENAIGITQFDPNGHLAFPTLLPLNGKPLLMSIGTLKKNGKLTLAVILDKDGQRSLATVTPDGKVKTQKLSDSFKSNPVALAFHDANQDGLTDLVILIPYEKVKVLIQKTNGDFDEEDVDPPGGALDQPWLATADVDGDGKAELLLPQKNFVRAVVLEQGAKIPGTTNQPNWVFRVKDQINGAANDSRIIGATTVTQGTNATPSIFLFDAEHKQLTLCERDSAGVWQIVHNLNLPVADFGAIRTVQLGGSNVQSIAFLGQSEVGWLPLAGDVWEYQTLDGYDTPIKNGYLNDVIAGDLTGSGRKNLVFLETAKNYIDLVFFDAHHKLIPGDRWQVFEEHTFRGRDNGLPEPREAAVADVTGDHKNDLIILVHDRILVYPQE